MAEYVKGLGQGKIDGMNALRKKYPFLDAIIADQFHEVFEIVEKPLDESVLDGRTSDHDSQGPEAFDEQVYYISGDEMARALPDSLGTVRRELASIGVTSDLLVKTRHQKIEIKGVHHHDFSLTIFSAKTSSQL